MERYLFHGSKMELEASIVSRPPKKNHSCFDSSGSPLKNMYVFWCKESIFSESPLSLPFDWDFFPYFCFLPKRIFFQPLSSQQWAIFIEDELRFPRLALNDGIRTKLEGILGSLNKNPNIFLWIPAQDKDFPQQKVSIRL